jgi:hypothetical protein
MCPPSLALRRDRAGDLAQGVVEGKAAHGSAAPAGAGLFFFGGGFPGVALPVVAYRRLMAATPPALALLAVDGEAFTLRRASFFAKATVERCDGPGRSP